MPYTLYPKPSAGFTLIELLLVISIVSMLASVVLASLSDARGKATKAAGQQFSGQVFRAMGAEAVAIFNFDSGITSPNPNDESGNSQTLTCSSGGIIASSVPGIKSNAVRFAVLPPALVGSGSSGQCRNDTFPFKDFNASNGAVGFWVNPTVASADRYTMHIKGIWNQLLAGGRITLLGVTSSTALPIGKWSYVLASWGAGKTRLYINGKSDNSVAALPSFSGTVLILSGFGSTSGMEGIMDEFVIYSKSIESAQARQLYAAGAAEHGLAVK